MAPAELPSSYANLPFSDIRLHHHPRSSLTVTPIIVLELYRPKNANAFTQRMRDDVVEAYRLFELDDRVKAIVITGHGKFFCAGADLSVGFSKEIDGRKISHHRDGGGQVTLAIHNCSKPTIGALNGPGVGVGLTMTFPMTVRIASNKAKFGAVFARRGISSDAAASFFLPRLVGYSRAIYLTSTGGVFPSTSPHFGDLFNEIVEPDRVLPRALELAEEMVTNVSAVASKVIRDEMWRGPPTAEEAHLLESKLLIESFRSKDHQEGLKSFMEKRPPNFQATMSKDAPETWPWFSVYDITAPIESAKPKSKL